MAVFTAQTALDFNTMNQLATITLAPGTSYTVSATSFDVFDGDSIFGTGVGFSPTGTGRPTAGTINTLDVNDGFLWSTDAYTITGLAHSFSGLVTAINNGGAYNGLSFLLNGSDTVNGSNGNDVLRGFAGIDNVLGNGGADKLFGDGENDFLRGGAGKDFLDGGTGLDTADYSDKGKAVVAVLKGATKSIVTVGGKAEDTIKNIERLVGGSGNDKLTGDNQANSLTGNGGKDTLIGKGGIDLIRGNDANDVIDGGGAADNLYGGLGKDVIKGGAGADNIYGELGNDTLTGGAGADKFYFDTALDGLYNVDKITDFAVGVDKIMLDAGIFEIDKVAYFFGTYFVVGSEATSSEDRIIYNKASGKIFYDADGNGDVFGKILFATVAKNTDLHASDFQLVA